MLRLPFAKRCTSPSVRALLAAGLWLASAACATRVRQQPPQQEELVRAVSPPERLTPAEDLPGPVRVILGHRMAAHAHDMGALMSAVMILDYDQVQSRATAIVNDVSLARPLTGDATELNSALPERFFGFQDELRAAAKTLASAAADKSAFAVADAYGHVSETCVKCHAVYRQGRSGK